MAGDGSISPRRTMQEIRCYRIRGSSGSTLRLEPEVESPFEELLLVCSDEVRVGRSATGETLLYRDGPYGMQPEQAIQLGWVRLVEPEPASMNS